MKLRKFTVQDANRVASLVGDESVSKWTSNIPFPYKEQDAIDWISDTAINPDRHPFAVEIDNEIVACVSFWPYRENAIEVGYWVGKSYWGQGLCTEALTMLMSQDFFPKERDVIARVMEGNIGSERVLQKCGFTLFTNCTVKKSGKEIGGKLFVNRAAI
jgi:RimJ/RimL family protein N-acetyltransferase